MLPGVGVRLGVVGVGVVSVPVVWITGLSLRSVSTVMGGRVLVGLLIWPHGAAMLPRWCCVVATEWRVGGRACWRVNWLLQGLMGDTVDLDRQFRRGDLWVCGPPVRLQEFCQVLTRILQLVLI